MEDPEEVAENLTLAPGITVWKVAESKTIPVVVAVEVVDMETVEEVVVSILLVSVTVQRFSTNSLNKVFQAIQFINTD